MISRLKRMHSVFIDTPSIERVTNKCKQARNP